MDLLKKNWIGKSIQTHALQLPAINYIKIYNNKLIEYIYYFKKPQILYIFYFP